MLFGSEPPALLPGNIMGRVFATKSNSSGSWNEKSPSGEAPDPSSIPQPQAVFLIILICALVAILFVFCMTRLKDVYLQVNSAGRPSRRRRSHRLRHKADSLHSTDSVQSGPSPKNPQPKPRAEQMQRKLGSRSGEFSLSRTASIREKNEMRIDHVSIAADVPLSRVQLSLTAGLDPSCDSGNRTLLSSTSAPLLFKSFNSSPKSSREFRTPKPEGFRYQKDIISIQRTSSRARLQTLPNSMSASLLEGSVEQRTPSTPFIESPQFPRQSKLGMLESPGRHLLPVKGSSTLQCHDSSMKMILESFKDSALRLSDGIIHYIECDDFVVDYETTLGEDAFRSLHRGKFRRESVLVQCLSESVTELQEAETNLSVRLARSLLAFLKRGFGKAFAGYGLSIAEKSLSAWSNMDVVQLCLGELRIMRCIQPHRNILPMVAVSNTTSDLAKVYFTIWPFGKPLIEVIFNLIINWYDDDVLGILNDVVSALQHAHSKGIAHGGLTILDIWLFQRSNSGNTNAQFRYIAKVNGFGWNTASVYKRYDSTIDAFRKHIYGRYLDATIGDKVSSQALQQRQQQQQQQDKPQWFRPMRASASLEVGLGTQRRSWESGQALDIVASQRDAYSIGALMYECLERYPLFGTLSPMAVRKAIVDERRRPTIDLQKSLANAAVRCMDPSLKRRLRVTLLELLSRCWAIDAACRPRMSEVLRTLGTMIS